MSKDIHTPREELICGAIDRAEDIARDHSLVYLLDELARIRNHAERMEAKLVSRKQEAEHHELYVQALKSELAALKAGQGEAVAWADPLQLAALLRDCSASCAVWNSPGRSRVPLYATPPAPADARAVPTWAVPVGLLAHVESLLACPQLHTRNEYIKAAEELRALLAQSQEVKS